MNLWFRVLRVLLLALRRPRLGPLDESRIDFRVWPTDLDINVHMNNARYMALMDLGRLDMIVRTGIGRQVTRERLQPVIANASVRFRRALGPFQRFTLRTRLLGWDDKWMYIEHRLERDGEVACRAVVRGLFLGKGGAVPPAELLRDAGHAAASPALPDWVATWQALDAAQSATP